MVQGESLPQTALLVFANDGYDKIAGIPIEGMGLRQFGGILRADRQTNTNRPVKFRQLNQFAGVLGCVQSFQRIPLGSTMSSSRVSSYRQRSAKTTGVLQKSSFAAIPLATKVASFLAAFL